MYKTKKEIEEWIKAFNTEQIVRMRADNYLDYIDEDDLNGKERFRSGGEWSVELVAPQSLLDLLPEWESECWWEVDIIRDMNIPEEYALEEYGVQSLDEINSHFARRFYDISLDEEEYWVSLEKEFEGKTGLPFEVIRVEYG